MNTSKQTYVKPACAMYGGESVSLLQASGNAGTIGVGGSGGDAKRGFFEENEDEPARTTFVHGIASSSNRDERTDE